MEQDMYDFHDNDDHVEDTSTYLSVVLAIAGVLVVACVVGFALYDAVTSTACTPVQGACAHPLVWEDR